jgi:hypothetical protein
MFLLKGSCRPAPFRDYEPRRHSRTGAFDLSAVVAIKVGTWKETQCTPGGMWLVVMVS